METAIDGAKSNRWSCISTFCVGRIDLPNCKKIGDQKFAAYFENEISGPVSDSKYLNRRGLPVKFRGSNKLSPCNHKICQNKVLVAAGVHREEKTQGVTLPTTANANL